MTQMHVQRYVIGEIAAISAVARTFAPVRYLRDKFFPLGLTDPCAIQNLDWLRAIERSADPETSGKEGLRDLACAFAILESSVLGRAVTLHEVLDGAVDTSQRDIDQYYGLLP